MRYWLGTLTLGALCAGEVGPTLRFPWHCEHEKRTEKIVDETERRYAPIDTLMNSKPGSHAGDNKDLATAMVPWVRAFPLLVLDLEEAAKP